MNKYLKYIHEDRNLPKPVPPGFIGGGYSMVAMVMLSVLTDPKFFDVGNSRVLVKMVSDHELSVSAKGYKLKPFWERIIGDLDELPIPFAITEAQMLFREDEANWGPRDPFNNVRIHLPYLYWFFHLSSYAKSFRICIPIGKRTLTNTFKDGFPVGREWSESEEQEFRLELVMDPSFFPEEKFSRSVIEEKLVKFEFGQIGFIGDKEKITFVG